MSLSPLHYQDAVRAALTEDLGHHGDITSLTTLPADYFASASMNTRAHGVLAGLEIAICAFTLIDPDLKFKTHAKDGDLLKPGDPILTIEGRARSIFTGERVALNYLSHLSGIASATAGMVHECAGTHTKIADTRKTTPNMRSLEKYAVRMGGGSNHRFGLDDAVLIKDNHIAAAGSIDAVLNAAKDSIGHMVKIEIEVDTLGQLQEVLDNGKADIVMIDNFDLKDTKAAVDLVNETMTVEYSGTVTADKVAAIAATGVDIISSGWITHSAPALDIGLDVNLNT
jgi:nicotinate-nucleotide pyrophosphorylase (carboxylating)